MEKVSKNLRRLRKANGITQEQLAEELHITRQAISNWENNKTQPDIASLAQLAKIFEVEIEELIYGEKRQVGTEVSAERVNTKIRIILAVAGSLLVGVGLFLIFFSFWKEFPLPIQTVFSLIPMLGAQGFALYVFLRRKEDMVWCECAALLWCVGMISTVALINSIFHIHCGYINCLLIDILICLPVAFLLRAASPLALYFYMIIHWSLFAPHPAIAVFLLAIPLCYPLLLRRKEDERYKYTVWVSAIAAVIFAEAQPLLYESDSYALLGLCILPFLALYAVGSRDSDCTLPFKPLGILGCAGALTANTIFTWMENPSISYWNFLPSAFADEKTTYIFCLLGLVLTAGAVIFGRRSFSENLSKILLCGFSLGGACAAILYGLVLESPLLWLTVLCTVGFGGTLIFVGLQQLKLMPANLGLIVIFIQLFLLVYAQNISTLLLGVILLLFGAALIAVNYEMNMRKKEKALLEKAKGAENDA